VNYFHIQICDFGKIDGYYAARTSLHFRTKRIQVFGTSSADQPNGRGAIFDRFFDPQRHTMGICTYLAIRNLIESNEVANVIVAWI